MRSVRKVFLERECFTEQVGYWAYEVCPFRRVQQYHPESDRRSLKMDLGSYDRTHDMFTPSTYGFEYKQKYTEGTDGRQTIISILCTREKMKEKMSKKKKIK